MNAEQVYRASPGWLQTVLLNVHAWQIERHRYGRPFRAAVDALRAQERWPREKTTEHKFLTPVFGTAQPPTGISGAIRKLSYARYSEGTPDERALAAWMQRLGMKTDAVEQLR